MPNATETWKTVVGLEDAYEVSSEGRVRSLDRVIFRKDGAQVRRRGKLLTPGLSDGRYLTVALGRSNTRSVHTLVAEAFLGPCPEGCEVLHGGGGALDNRVTNLRYGSHSQNSFDRYRDGTVHNAKCVWRSDGRTFRSVHAAARDTGVAISSISCAARGLLKSAAGFQWEYVDA